MPDAVRISSPDGSTEAEFVPAANLLCSSLRVEGVEFLDHGEGVEAYAEQGKTMGVPLLYPWANRLARFGYEAAGRSVSLPEGDERIPVDPGGLPIHGVLPRLLDWEVQAAGGERLRATLEWDADELFPYSHQLHVEAVVDRGSLRLATTVLASRGDAVPVSFGYHPYLRVPQGDREQWQVTLGAEGHLELDPKMIPTGQSDPVQERRFTLAGRSLDDAYDRLLEPPLFTAASGAGAVSVEFLGGYTFAQVYAPPGKDFICFEPMTAPTNALVSGRGLRILEPGQEHRAEFSITASLATAGS